MEERKSYQLMKSLELKQINLNFQEFKEFREKLKKSVKNIDNFAFTLSLNSNYIDLIVKNVTIEDIKILNSILEEFQKRKQLKRDLENLQPIDEWDYTLDEDNGFVILNKYKGESDSYLIIEPSYVINNKTYKTKFVKCVNMFNTNERLETIEFKPGIDCSELTTMDRMFASCTNLTHIIGLENLDTSKVTKMQLMFAFCKSLTDLDLTSFNTSNVTDMGSMFYECKSLTLLLLDNFDTSNVISMKQMFSGCKSLTDLDLSSFDTRKVADMQWMFEDCKSLFTLDIVYFCGDFINIDGMFDKCYNLTKIRVLGSNEFVEFKDLPPVDSIYGKFYDAIIAKEPAEE